MIMTLNVYKFRDLFNRVRPQQFILGTAGTPQLASNFRLTIGALATITANVPLTAQHRMEREYHILLVAPMAQPNLLLVYELDKAYELCYDYLTRGRMG